ncbi:hypothetical protein [Janibacter sp. GXQ6167]|uniref:hypothetical protein n=1 Tax=Janibacter sp. GXQ6167 TaxID=3240791 RepID=UPI0035249E69
MPNAIEGGRFTEAVLRILEWDAKGHPTALGDSKFKADQVIKQLESIATATDSIRLHIPRALRVIYAIRNKRDTGHLTDGIDPNIQDATLVIAVMDWVMAELVRLYHSASPAEAQALIEELVTREVPMIEVFNGKPRILKDLRASEHVLVLLYWSGRLGVSMDALSEWVPTGMRTNLRRTVNQLHAKHMVHFEDNVVRLTMLGARHVIDKKLIRPL